MGGVSGASGAGTTPSRKGHNGGVRTTGMPFGDTAKKVQRLSTLAEQTYEKINQLVSQLQDLRERVESTSDQLDTMDRELAEQRAIVEALAAEQGVDVDEIVAQVEEERGESAESDEATESPEAEAAEGADSGDGSTSGSGDETDASGGGDSSTNDGT